jgi:hypothetical protein
VWNVHSKHLVVISSSLHRAFDHACAWPVSVILAPVTQHAHTRPAVAVSRAQKRKQHPLMSLQFKPVRMTDKTL